MGSGLRSTAATGAQFRVLPDQRSVFLVARVHRAAKRHELSRVMAHRKYAQIAHFIERAPQNEDFSMLLQRVRRAVAAVERQDDD